jgi:uncharacterized DUF497 family protein
MGGCYTICITMRFEWDSRKNRINQTKHNGLDFETAARIFDDPNVMFMEDRVVEGEQRWFALGVVSRALLVVVHVYCEDDVNGEEVIRIISAREANQRERRIYIQQAAQ